MSPQEEATMNTKVDNNTLLLLHIALNYALDSILESANEGHQRAFNQLINELIPIELELQSRGIPFKPVDLLSS